MWAARRVTRSRWKPTRYGSCCSRCRNPTQSPSQPHERRSAARIKRRGGAAAHVLANASHHTFDLLLLRRWLRVLIHSEHDTNGERIVGIEGDPLHPANHGRLCSKGLALPQTVASTQGRVLEPELRRHRQAPRAAVSWDQALSHVTNKLAAIIEEHGPDAVAFYLSGQLLTEDYYVFNKLAKGLLGTNNIDTNSRLCMSSAVTGYKLALGADGPPTCYEDLELAQTVLFAGSNMAYAHPVLFRRLEAARARNPEIRWIVIDPRRTDTAPWPTCTWRSSPEPTSHCSTACCIT